VSSAPEDPAVARERALERLLRHERAITVAALVALVALAWSWLLAGAGIATQASTAMMATMAPMSSMPSMPDMSAMPAVPAAPVAWTPAMWALMLAMWWTMMIAMMTPSAAPTILLYARVHRHAAAQGRILGSSPPTGAFAIGYLLLWMVFATAACAIQYGLEQAGLLSAGSLGAQGRRLSAGLLLVACSMVERGFRLASNNQANDAGAIVAVGTGFVTIWANLAVGMILSERNLENLVFLGVIGIALVGAFFARFRAQGMAKAMLAAGIAQGVIALVVAVAPLDDLYTAGLIGAFALPWLLSAALFRQAAGDQAFAQAPLRR
jgi:hypothetical protein